MKETIYIIQTPPFWLKTPPLSLIYLKNYLKTKDIEVKIIDFNIILFKLFSLPVNKWLGLNKEFEEELFFIAEKKFPYIWENFYKKIEDAQFIGFSLFKRNAPFSFQLAQRIKEKFPSKKIIFGGPHTFFLEKNNQLDNENFWVIGEGEIPLYKIILNNPKKTYYFEEIPQLDTLGFPDFDSLNLKIYSNSIPLLSSRGCPHQCNFCSEKKLYHKFRHHSPQYMAEQIQYLKNKYSVNHFIFCDSLINYENDWLRDFCSLILKHNLSINWEAQMRITPDFPIELAQLMKKSGCFNLFVGLESGSDKILKLMNKGFNTACAVNFFNTFKKARLHFEISLILGYPGEEEIDFYESLIFVKKNKHIIPKIAQVNPFVDYLDDFPKNTYPTKEALKRVNIFLKMLTKEKIRHTKSFINNLIEKY